MKPVFANSAWVKAPEKLILREGRWKQRQLRVRYGVFIHPKVGPILIDTGYTSHSLSALGRSALLRAYGHLLSPKLNLDAQPAWFLQRFGLAPKDIIGIIITHFHADHVSGLAAFPDARLIASKVGYPILQQGNSFENIRHGVFPELLPLNFGARLELIEDHPRVAVHQLPDSYDIFKDGSVLAVPLPGHAQGHFGVLFAQRKTPLLYATDTQWLIEALQPPARPRLFPRLISEDYRAMCRSADQVAAFRNSGATIMLCHDDASTPFDVEEGAKL
jgi:glyoxylase-like metal-dependent hydrolase (beta-lactamase superfamily II)